MNAFAKIHIELKEYAEDGNTLLRRFDLETSIFDEAWTHVDLHGGQLKPDELAAIQKIIEGANDLEAAINGKSTDTVGLSINEPQL